MIDQTQLDQKAINTIRFLAVDAVQKANSGHPGTPMGAATLAYTLWGRFLKHNPMEPTFYVPQEVETYIRKTGVEKGHLCESEWNHLLALYTKQYPHEAAKLAAELCGDLSRGWDESLDALFPSGSTHAAKSLLSN